MKVVVTGGAGFIGSHLVDALVNCGDAVTVIDNLSTGDLRHIDGHIKSGAARFVHADLRGNGWQDDFLGQDRVYHLAADPDVRASAGRPSGVFDQNVVATVNVLEAMRKTGCSEIVFTSTSTVYGEAEVIPTPEHYENMEPISIYGGTKLACEAMISSYAHTYGGKAWIYRFANIIGRRSNHGVIWDFIHKLRGDPQSLEILGDGRQSKSYLEVKACVHAMLYAADHSGDTVNTFNIGSEDWIDVSTIADLVVEGMGLSGVTYRFTGGERGWVGDVPRMQLSVEKLRSLGWTPGVNSRESVEEAVEAMLH